MKERVVDENILRAVRLINCLPCFPKEQTTPTEADHVTTRGAGGDDSYENVWPLCTEHHRERHQIGLLTFVRKYPILRRWLEAAKRTDILEKVGPEEKRDARR